VVWVSVSGEHIESLGGWTTRAQAEAAIHRCVGALNKGHPRFLEEVKRARSTSDYVAPGPFTSEERDQLAQAALAKMT
jgi:hypothetical protein